MTVSANNLVYWLRQDIDSKTWWTLRRLARGDIPPDRVFETAYLIALECVTHDNGTFTITAKGQECLEFFRPDYCPSVDDTG